MNYINELIEKYCPNGVQKFKLNSISEIYDGTHQTPNYTDSGIKFVSVENINNLYASTKLLIQR